eukprot:TRINITY_DN61294_c0_g1_i1.p1 TRINITY_DN61294_c0_g1~~TRINITY_DN61294_c0_g1_i1.p1  ORF type:complete len:371 (-),score=52.50 TRINITY_DN61294_c0_g1_i1:277-1389(-)
MCDDASFLCPSCGGLVREARRQAHETYWCPSLKAACTKPNGTAQSCASTGASEDSEHLYAMHDTDTEDEDRTDLPVELLRLTSSQYEPVLEVYFSFAPNCRLSFEQQVPPSRGMKSDRDTGGQMWWSELVLSEYLVESGRCGSSAATEFDCQPNEMCERLEQPLRALALGCGAAPASCFVAAALGWDILLTDLEEVLAMTNRNLKANSAIVDAVRVAVGREDCPSGRMATAALTFGQPLSATVRDWVTDGGISLILCSDLIWEEHRHRPLASTLAELLAPPLAASSKTEVLLAFQRRQLDELKFFPVLKHFGLEHEQLDVSSSVRRAPFGRQLLEQIRRSGSDAVCWFCVHRIWRAIGRPDAAEGSSVEA